jgi:hypothetical protein
LVTAAIEGMEQPAELLSVGGEPMQEIAAIDTTLRPEGKARYLLFVRQVMADVYALLDFLSGRARPSLTSPPYRRHNGAAARRNPDANGTPRDSVLERERIEADLEQPTTLIQRAMQIGKSLGEGNVSPDDAAFLVRARDLLNLRAAPASGSSIVFTLLVISKSSSRRSQKHLDEDRSHFIYDGEHLEIAASQLAHFVRWALRAMVILLVFAVALSAYVAWGKLLLDTRDAMLHDWGANESVFAAQMVHGAANPAEKGEAIDAACNAGDRSFIMDQACRQHDELVHRRKSVVEHLQSWDRWGSDTSEEAAVQHVAVAVGVIGNYILPVLYGALGAMASMLRQLYRRVAERLLTPRDRRAAHIRLMLGVLTGACIGLFFNSSTGSAQATGIGGAAVTLSASAIAFLAGYAVEAVFTALDTVVSHIFRAREESRDAADNSQPLIERHS